MKQMIRFLYSEESFFKIQISTNLSNIQTHVISINQSTTNKVWQIVYNNAKNTQATKLNAKLRHLEQKKYFTIQTTENKKNDLNRITYHDPMISTRQPSDTVHTSDQKHTQKQQININRDNITPHQRFDKTSIRMPHNINKQQSTSQRPYYKNTIHANNDDQRIPSESSNTTNLVTDLTKSLSETELKLLAKGPNFIIKKTVNEHLMTDIKSQFFRLAYQLRWQEIIKAQQNNHQSSFIRYPISSTLTNPTLRNDNLENKLKRIYAKLENITNELPKKQINNNLTKEELSCLANLKRKELIYLPSDKGKEFCIIEKSKYNDAANQHLNDTNIYKHIPRLKAKTVETKINNIWKGICKTLSLPKPILKNFTTNNSEFAQFYCLIKTHKIGPNIRIRPIVANINTPTTKISWLLQQLLGPMLKTVPAHLENSLQLLNTIRDMPTLDRQQNCYPISLDVVALYTSVPCNDAIQIISEILQHTNFNYNGITQNEIEKLLSAILSSTYFTFNGKIYKQISGLPMGNCLSGTLAILFMNRLEQKVLLDNNICLYRRYVDDIFILCENREKAIDFHTAMNQQHPNIIFEIEFPNDTNSLSLLDFTIQIKNNGDFDYLFSEKRL